MSTTIEHREENFPPTGEHKPHANQADQRTEQRLLSHVVEARHHQYLSPEEIIRIQAEYSHVARQVLHEGNPDLLKRAEEDQELVDNILKRGQRLSLDLQHRQPIRNVLASLCQIINSEPHQHTMFGRIIAAIAYCELSLQHQCTASDSVPLTLFEAIDQAEKNHPNNQYVWTLLFGAYRARLFYHAARADEGSDNSSQLGAYFEPPTDEDQSWEYQNQQAKEDLAIATVGQVFYSLLSQEQLNLRLPFVTLSEATVIETNTYDQPEDPGYPDSVMFLSPGNVTSMQKLVLSVTVGVPTVSGIMEYRIPKLMAGVLSSNRGAQYESQTDSAGKIKDGRRFTYIHLPSLRQPNFPAAEVFSGNSLREIENFTDDEVVRFGAFDTLSFICAVRVTRSIEQTGHFQKWEERHYSQELATLSEAQVRARIESRKLRYTNKVINKFIEKLTTEYPTPSGQERSIFSVALAESQHIYGSEDWGRAEVLDHLRHSVRALVLKKEHITEAQEDDYTLAVHLRLRTVDEMMNLYRRKLIEEDLTTAQKATMALRLLAQRMHALWGVLESEYGLTPEGRRMLIAHIKDNSVPLSNEVLEVLATAVVRFLELRLETIRNKRGPKDWEVKDEEEDIDV